jgi:hypothetical protein
LFGNNKEEGGECENKSSGEVILSSLLFHTTATAATAATTADGYNHA